MEFTQQSLIDNMFEDLIAIKHLHRPFEVKICLNEAHHFNRALQEINSQLCGKSEQAASDLLRQLVDLLGLGVFIEKFVRMLAFGYQHNSVIRHNA